MSASRGAWRSCSRRRRRCGSRRRPSSCSAAMGTCGTFQSKNSSETQRSPRSMKAPAKFSGSSSRVASTAPSPAGRKTDLFGLLAEHGHEQVSLYQDPTSGYRGIIAIHDTRLGPALGGTRFWHYQDDLAALVDALRLARGMTYKAAVAGINLGGGKSVIIGDNKTTRREPIFRAHGRHVESLNGRYITAEDVGTSTADMEFIRAETEHVTGLLGKSGDPSPVTAYGVYRGIKACAQVRWGSDSLTGKTIVVQGCGHVGYSLCKLLHDEGARLFVADIVAPCALGSVINDDTLPQLKVAIVAGAANNQLAEDRHGEEIEAKGILYAPDYVINGGGLINVNAELHGWSLERARNKAGEIYDTILRVFDIAKEEKIPSYQAADRLAEQRIAAVAGVRQNFV